MESLGFAFEHFGLCVKSMSLVEVVGDGTEDNNGKV